MALRTVHRSGVRQKVKSLPLVAATFFMVSGGPYGIEDILGGAGYRVALLMLALLPFCWSIPTALMIGELGSALPDEGGFYVWVRRAMGARAGFLEAWLSLVASIFDMAIYPTLAVLYLQRLAPSLTTGHRGTLWALALIAVATALNLRGARAVGQSSTLMGVLLLSPFAVLALLALLHAPAQSSAGFAAGPGDLATALLVAMWNYMGWDNASTIAGEVENPRRTYPRAMLAAVALVTLSYLLPILAMHHARLSPAGFTTGSWVEAARNFGGPALGLAIVLGGIVNGFGMFNALMLSYTRLPLALAEDGLLPSWFARCTAAGVPWVSIVVCACGWALALRLSFERLISMDLLLYGGSLVLELIALVVLRVREPGLPRPFRIPGGLGAVALTAALPTATLLVALYLSRGERLAGVPTLGVAALVTVAGLLAYELTARTSAHAKRPDAS